jgi:hypothetical protein
LVAAHQLAALAVAVAAAADILTPAGNRVVRVAPGAGFWIVLIGLGLLATDALTRLRPGPAACCDGSPPRCCARRTRRGLFDDLSIARAP